MRGLQIGSILERLSCKDEEASGQVVGRNRAETGEWGKTGLALEWSSRAVGISEVVYLTPEG
mgnify:CR=1 FL=1